MSSHVLSFLIKLFLLSFRSSLSINPISVIWFKYFLLFCDLPFYSVDNCHEIQFVFFLACAFGVTSKKSVLNPVFWSFCPTFSSKSFIVLHCDTFWVNFCLWCQVRIQLYSFTCGDPIFQHHLLKRVSPLNGLGTLAKICWCEGLFLLTILHWFICLSLSQHHTVLMTIALL